MEEEGRETGLMVAFIYLPPTTYPPSYSNRKGQPSKARKDLLPKPDSLNVRRR